MTELSCACVRGDGSGALSAAGTAEDVLRDMSARNIDAPADVQALIRSNKGVALLLAGDLGDAAVTLTEALRSTDGPGCEHLRMVCLGQLSVVEALRGHLRRAAEHGRRAYAAADRCGLTGTQRPATADVALAWVYAEEYDLAAARTHIDRAASALRGMKDATSMGLLALIRARRHRARGDLAGAVTVIERIRPTGAGAGIHAPWLQDMLGSAETALRMAGWDA